jgi:polyhydroxyalkanoate synthesis repressor PhaR
MNSNREQDKAMSESRMIRKYVNRRLYDTFESRYVNLDDLRRVINAGGEISVVDQSSGKDITTTVLLQIIGEAERSGAPLLTADFLSALIRLSGRERDPGLADRLHAALRTALADGRATRIGLEGETGRG